MNNAFIRTISLIGKEAFKKIQDSKVIVFGLGGVGGSSVECLVRSGIGTIGIVDFDIVSESNLNRQIIATQVNLNKLKTDCFEERIKTINPDCKVIKYSLKYSVDTAKFIDLTEYDYIICCIDEVKAVVELVKNAKEKNIPIIISTGTGKKLDSQNLKIININQTHNDPLAKSIRLKLKEQGITDVYCLFSDELPIETMSKEVASMIFVPMASGIKISEYVIKKLIGRL